MLGPVLPILSKLRSWSQTERNVVQLQNRNKSAHLITVLRFVSDFDCQAQQLNHFC